MIGEPRLTSNDPEDIQTFLEEWLAGPAAMWAGKVADLPDATEYYHEDRMFLIGVTDETGGATLAFSDGTNWRRVQDRAIVS